MTTLKVGDLHTVAGHYAKRTFWQWLLRRPKELEQLVVTGVAQGTMHRIIKHETKH